MSWWIPEDFIAKVWREWIKIRWIWWPALVQQWDNIM